MIPGYPVGLQTNLVAQFRVSAALPPFNRKPVQRVAGAVQKRHKGADREVRGTGFDTGVRMRRHDSFGHFDSGGQLRQLIGGQFLLERAELFVLLVPCVIEQGGLQWITTLVNSADPRSRWWASFSQ